MPLRTTEALLLRSVPYGESDLIVTLLTAEEGRVSAIVRAGRKGAKRLGGALEPFHTMEAMLEERGRELHTFREARIVRLRLGIEKELGAIDAAGTALRWVRHFCPPRVPEPQAWHTLSTLLDDLDTQTNSPRAVLASAGIHLLKDVGWAIELERCVRCARICPLEKNALFDAGAGGIVCRGCGGGRFFLAAAARRAALDVMSGEVSLVDEPSATTLLLLVDATLAAHTDFER